MDQKEISYRRNAGASYMILPQREDVSSFEEEMLKNNDIPVLLPFFTFCEEGMQQLWYDITGKKSMRHYFEHGEVERKRICSFLLLVLEAFHVLEGYLIPNEHIVLREDTLFIAQEERGEEVYLCFFPGENGGLSDGLVSLYEYLMPLIDREDETLVSLIYDGYKKLVDGSFSVMQLKEQLQNLLFEESKRSLQRPVSDTEKEGSHYAADTSSDLERNGSRYIDRSRQDARWFNQGEQEEGDDSLRGKKTGLKRFAFWKKDEEDFWGEEQEDGEDEKLLRTMADDDDPDLEELYAEMNRSWLDTIKESVFGAPKKLFGRVKGKKEEYFPPRDLEEDLIYDPGETLSAPTVLLAEREKECFGRLVYEGSDKERDYVLDKPEYRVGSRDNKNEILLHSSAVSRCHARIFREADDYYIVDLNSTNGTFVNGETVNINEPRKLNYMDKILFADVAYRMV